MKTLSDYYLSVSTKQKEAPLLQVPELLYGTFFEDINYGGDGGLYNEYIVNRSFEFFDPDGKENLHLMGWEIQGNSPTINTQTPLSEVNPHYLSIHQSNSDDHMLLKNLGYNKAGFSVKENQSYNLQFYTRLTDHSSDSTKGSILLHLSDSFGELLADPIPFYPQSDKWSPYDFTFIAKNNCSHAFISIEFKGIIHIDLDFISLFPEDTYKNRKRGLRKDLAILLEELQPKFLRFPGGCIVEGRSFDNMYRWKDTIGPLIDRPVNWNRWRMSEYQQDNRTSDDYFQTYGLGFYEYFQLCEDIGASPVPIINTGLTCQWHEGDAIPLDELEPFIQDALDLIDFANGDGTSYWSKKRVEMGHSEPFHLKYLGIGNEQWEQVYFERYELFHQRIKAVYPTIQLITSSGPFSEGEYFEKAMTWLKTTTHMADVIDEHFYNPPEWFINNIHRYDDYDRKLSKVFIGEYAAHTSETILDRKNNYKCAISEAAFLTGVEKNCDHVVMNCYAPLFAKIDHSQWQPNLIWFDNDKSIKTPSYQVQKLFASNQGTHRAPYELTCHVQEEKGNYLNHGLEISVQYDSSANQMIIKGVHIRNTESTIDLSFDQTIKQVSCQSIHSDDLKTENTLTDPERIHIEQASLPYNTTSLTYVLSPYETVVFKVQF